MAEFIGTFALVFAGIASLASGGTSLAVALAFGLTVMVMIAVHGALSYAHFNPAVSFAFWVMTHISFKNMLLYWPAELTGAVFAMVCLSGLFGSERLSVVNYGATLLIADLVIFQAF